MPFLLLQGEFYPLSKKPLLVSMGMKTAINGKTVKARKNFPDNKLVYKKARKQFPVDA